MMQAEVFYSLVRDLLSQPAADRRDGLAALHERVLAGYVDCITRLNAEQAAQRVPDGRTRAQVVGHIAEWDRYTILAAGEMLAAHKQVQMWRHRGYLDEEGLPHVFKSVDDFNAFQARRQADLPWEDIQHTALYAARRLHALFTNPALVSVDLLEAMPPQRWKQPGGEVSITTVGWYLWIIILEHEAVEHTADLTI